MTAHGAGRAGGAAAGRRLRAGLVGIGAMGRHHARVLRSLEGVELVGVVDPAGDPQGYARGTPVLRALPDLVGAGLDYAVVASPTASHERVGRYLAEHGVAALVEKPLAPTAAAARRLAKAFESRGLVAGVGHIERCNPALLGLRARLEAGELGEVFQVATRRQSPFPHRVGDVGVVMDLATHDIDLTSWIAGQEYASVCAHTAARSGRAHEDMVTVTGVLGGGCLVSHLVNWLSPFRERCVVVTGARGCFVADTLAAELTFHANGGPLNGPSEGGAVRCAVAGREPLLVEHERFRDAVGGADAGIVGLRRGLRTVETAAAVLRSAATGEAVSTAPAGLAPARG